MYTGADLKNVCREAAMIALRDTGSATNVVGDARLSPDITSWTTFQLELLQKSLNFHAALDVVKPSLTRQSLASYREYASPSTLTAEFG
jgi:SpoVK/Ycf46/Vps4 family AAA+-type ATPase